MPLRQEKEISRKNGAPVCSGEQLDAGSGFESVKMHQTDSPVTHMCRIAGALHQREPRSEARWVRERKHLPRADVAATGEAQGHRDTRVSRVGLEPTTYGLKVRCSTN